MGTLIFYLKYEFQLLLFSSPLKFLFIPDFFPLEIEHKMQMSTKKNYRNI